MDYPLPRTKEELRERMPLLNEKQLRLRTLNQLEAAGDGWTKEQAQEFYEKADKAENAERSQSQRAISGVADLVRGLYPSWIAPRTLQPNQIILSNGLKAPGYEQPESSTSPEHWAAIMGACRLIRWQPSYPVPGMDFDSKTRADRVNTRRTGKFVGAVSIFSRCKVGTLVSAGARQGVRQDSLLRVLAVPAQVGKLGADPLEGLPCLRGAMKNTSGNAFATRGILPDLSHGGLARKVKVKLRGLEDYMEDTPSDALATSISQEAVERIDAIFSDVLRKMCTRMDSRVVTAPTLDAWVEVNGETITMSLFAAARSVAWRTALEYVKARGWEAASKITNAVAGDCFDRVARRWFHTWLLSEAGRLNLETAIAATVDGVLNPIVGLRPDNWNDWDRESRHEYFLVVNGIRKEDACRMAGVQRGQYAKWLTGELNDMSDVTKRIESTFLGHLERIGTAGKAA